MSSNNFYLATGSKEGIVRIWDIYSHMKEYASVQADFEVTNFRYNVKERMPRRYHSTLKITLTQHSIQMRIRNQSMDTFTLVKFSFRQASTSDLKMCSITKQQLLMLHLHANQSTQGLYMI